MRTKINNEQEAEQLLKVAFGRILRLGSRPFQSGDMEQYESAKWVMLDAFKYLNMTAPHTDCNYTQQYHSIPKD